MTFLPNWSRVIAVWMSVTVVSSLALLCGCGTITPEKAFVIEKTSEFPGFPWKIDLVAKEVSHFNVHLMQPVHDVGKFDAELFLPAREGLFRGEDLIHFGEGRRGTVKVTRNSATIDLELALVADPFDPERRRVVKWVPCEFNGTYRLLDLNHSPEPALGAVN